MPIDGELHATPHQGTTQILRLLGVVHGYCRARRVWGAAVISTTARCTSTRGCPFFFAISSVAGSRRVSQRATGSVVRTLSHSSALTAAAALPDVICAMTFEARRPICDGQVNLAMVSSSISLRSGRPAGCARRDDRIIHLIERQSFLLVGHQQRSVLEARRPLSESRVVHGVERAKHGMLEAHQSHHLPSFHAVFRLNRLLLPLTRVTMRAAGLRRTCGRSWRGKSGDMEKVNESDCLSVDSLHNPKPFPIATLLTKLYSDCNAT